MLPRPMLHMLRTASGRASMHMPGHHGRVPLRYRRCFALKGCFPLDLTELPITDDLYAPRAGIAQAQRLMARSAGSEGSIFLHGGATAGIQAMLLYALNRGDTVILPRNAHRSVISACMLYGFEPVFAELEQTTDGLLFTTVESYIRAIAAHPEARAVLATTPDYYGVIADIAPIARAAHEKGLLLLVDEAHGAHMCWQGTNAVRRGADIAVQSAHKTLPALTGAATLTFGRGVDARRLTRLLAMAQTSSPSFLIALSIDDARDWMDRHGEKALGALRAAINDFWLEAARLGYRSAHALWREQGLELFDETRLVIDAPQGGYALSDALAKRSIDVELADERRVCCILSLLEGKYQLARLIRALRLIRPVRRELPAPPALPPLPRRTLPISDAMRLAGEIVPLENAAGRVALDMAGLYPPGVPVALPGELISKEAAETLLRAPDNMRFGVTDGALRCVTSEEMRDIT